MRFPSAVGTQRAFRHGWSVSEILKESRRTAGTAQEGKSPLFTADLRRIVAALPDSLRGYRDRALLVMGFAGGFRRSELAALNVEDVVTYRLVWDKSENQPLVMLSQVEPASSPISRGIKAAINRSDDNIKFC